jgi:hypothetical protein
MVLRQADTILVLGTVQPFDENQGLVSAYLDDHTVAINDRSASITHRPGPGTAGKSADAGPEEATRHRIGRLVSIASTEGAQHAAECRLVALSESVPMTRSDSARSPARVA